MLPRENIFVTRLEDYSKDREKVLGEMYEFLDLGMATDDICNKTVLCTANLADGITSLKAKD